jgi:hypothetical protein
VQSFYSSSPATGMLSWSTMPASSVAYKLNWEQFGNRDIPFFGDYNYISAVGSKVLMTWTDGRDTRSGVDLRYTNGDGTDGFEVFQTRACSGTPPSCGADTTPNGGGLDQNIWGLVIG